MGVVGMTLNTAFGGAKPKSAAPNPKLISN
jgi:hypothetical protein